MADREMVIKGLECCLPEDYEYAGNNPCMDCPYYHGSSCGSQQLLRDALELLREQEPVSAERRIEQKEFVVCGYCGGHLLHAYKFCPMCGRAVKWECG